MSPIIKPTLSGTINDWFQQNSEELERVHGIYLDGSIAEVINQICATLFDAMKYQSNLIKEHED
jgi:hypothetical protein